MADGGEGFKPGDFYVGVYELFAILLPGAILTYLVWKLNLQHPIEGSALQKLAPGGGAASYLTFVVLAYVVGHFLAAFGWVFMDTVFEAQRKNPFFAFVSDLEGRTREAVRASGKLPQIADLFPWAVAYIDIHYVSAAGKLEAIEADCKFFRNLIPALLLSLPIIDVSRFNWFSGTIIETVWIIFFFAYVAGASFVFRRQRRLGSQTSDTSLRPDPWFCRGITSFRWLLALLIIPVLTNIVLAWYRCERQQLFLIDLGILLAALLAIGRYMLLQMKRMTAAYQYLLAAFDPAPDSTRITARF